MGLDFSLARQYDKDVSVYGKKELLKDNF